MQHRRDAPYWSKEDERQLRNLLDVDTPLKELKKRFPNRSYNSVKTKLNRQKRAGSGQTKFKIKPWTSQDLEQLFHLRFVEKLTVLTVAIKMGRTFNSVSRKLDRLRRVNLNLANPQALFDKREKSP